MTDLNQSAYVIVASPNIIKKVSYSSGGQQRVSIGWANVNNPDILLCDSVVRHNKALKNVE